MTDYLVAADAETTGLHPWEGHKLLEIAVFIAESTAPFTLIDEGFHAVIRHSRDEVYALADDYVRDTHSKTGLWDKVESGTPLDEVDDQLLAYLQKHLGKRDGRIFGNSVRLDMNFIDTYLPKTAAWLHYRFLDASGLAWFANQNFGVPYFEKQKTHAAKDDIIESLGELEHVRSALIRRPTRDEIAAVVNRAVSAYAEVRDNPEVGASPEDFVIEYLMHELGGQ